VIQRESPFQFEHPTDFVRAVVTAMMRRNPRISLRSCAIRLGFSDVSVLSGLLRFRRSWNLGYALGLSDALALPPEERNLLELQVLGLTGRSTEERAYYERAVASLRTLQNLFNHELGDRHEIFTAGDCRVCRSDQEERWIELRRQTIDPGNRAHQEWIFRYSPGKTKVAINEILLGSPESKVSSPRFARDGTTIHSVVGGQLRSSFFKVDYGKPSLIEHQLTGQDVYANDGFFSDMRYCKPGTGELAYRELCNGSYVGKTLFEDLVAKLKGGDLKGYSRLRQRA
jgi:hypothetical protein